MKQSTLDLPPQPTDDGIDRTGFQIGWDHAHHGLVPPPGLLLAGTPIGQGWRAARAVFGHRTLPANRHTRRWLALRTLAWRQGISFELQQVTPNYLAQIDAERCPILRMPLGGAPGEPAAAVIERINPHAGYAAGNLVMISQRAAQVRQPVGVLEALRRAHRSSAEVQPEGALDAAAWLRLAALRSFATALPFAEAVRLPLAVLPPNRVRVLNAAQGLQTLLTLQFAAPGWSARTRAIAELLPQHTLRHDYNLFIGAIAPRVLEVGSAATGLREALEDAWLGERVQRRWQHFVLSLGEAGTRALLDRAAAHGLAAVRTLNHDDEQATDGWALGDGGRVRRPPALPRRLPRGRPAPTGPVHVVAAGPQAC